MNNTALPFFRRILLLLILGFAGATGIRGQVPAQGAPSPSSSLESTAQDAIRSADEPRNFQSESGVPVNDECANALEVHLGLNGPFDNLSASASALAWSCGSTTPPYDLWYYFTSPISTSYIIDTCDPATDFDTQIEVYEQMCLSGASVGCNDDGCGPSSLQSRVETFFIENFTYLIRVGGFNQSQGNFVLNIRFAGTQSNIMLTKARLKAAGNSAGSVQLQGMYNRGYFEAGHRSLAPAIGGGMQLGFAGPMWVLALDSQQASQFSMASTRHSLTDRDLALKMIFDERRSTFSVKDVKIPNLPEFSDVELFLMNFGGLVGGQELPLVNGKYRAGKTPLEGNLFFITKANFKFGAHASTDSFSLEGFFHTTNPGYNIGLGIPAVVSIEGWQRIVVQGLPFQSGGNGITSFTYDPETGAFLVKAKNISIGAPGNDPNETSARMHVQIRFGDFAVGYAPLLLRGDPTKSLRFP